MQETRNRDRRVDARWLNGWWLMTMVDDGQEAAVARKGCTEVQMRVAAENCGQLASAVARSLLSLCLRLSPKGSSTTSS